MSDDQQSTPNAALESKEKGKAGYIEYSSFGELPTDWTWEKSENHLEYITSGISESQNKTGEGIPVSRIETIADGVVNYDKVGYVSNDGDYSNHKLNLGDLLFSNINSRDEIGKTAMYKGENTLYHGMNLLRIRYSSDSFNEYFVYYIYDSPMAQDVFFRMSKAAVGQSSINQSQMERLFLPQPQLSEQRKIATVLHTIDQAIQKTEEIIKQIKIVKRGIKQDLLSEGYHQHDIEERRIGAQLRKIPSDWKTAELGEIAEYQNGYGFSKDQWSSTGRPIIRIQDLTTPEESDTNYFDGDIDSKYEVENGDILVSWSATLGVFRWRRGDAVLNQHIFKVRNIEDVVDEQFLHHILEDSLTELERKIHGSTMKHITRSAFEGTKVPLPPKDEQIQIAKTLDDIDQQIQSYGSYRNKLQRIRHGLMQDLLSGEVRTTDVEIDIPERIKKYG